MSNYGVRFRHMGLCCGANFTPALQTALLQQLGPATLAVGLLRQTGKLHQDKWIRTLVQQCSGVAKIEAVAREIAGKGTDRSDLVEKLLDLCLAGIAKVSCKGTMPWLFYSAIFRANAGSGTWHEEIYWKEGEPSTDSPRPRQFMVGSPIQDHVLPDSVLNMDYSGKGFWNFYHSGVNFQMKMKPDGMAAHYRQSVSLAITGLYYEDFAILKHMFGKNPVLRKDMTLFFEELKSKGKSAKTTLWQTRNVCKMATASQTKLGSKPRAECFSRVQSIRKEHPKNG